ncbi:MAG: choice-of-anchor L domain-containing protein, partial [Thermococcus sp.]|nr:choice-of-anchor L domain-containing protein [Thermococcus sp.]
MLILKKLITLSIIFLFLASLEGFATSQSLTKDAEQEALAILTEDSKDALISATFEGGDGQVYISTVEALGFPTDGDSYVILSSGIASEAVDGSIGSTGGISIPNGHPVFGTEINDVATLTIKLKVPSNAETLSFKWLFGSNEIPDYVDEYRDFFRAYVILPDGSTKDMALLPNGNIPYVGDGIQNYTAPDPTVNINEVTSTYTATLDVSKYRGKQITLVFQIADEGDDSVDTFAFIDELKFVRGGKGKADRRSYIMMIQIWSKYFFNEYDQFVALYAKAEEIGVSNETLEKALELHLNATEQMLYAWHTDDLESIRIKIWK